MVRPQRSHGLGFWSCVIAITMCLVPRAALAQGARLQLDNLDRLQKQATEVVNITLDQSMLQLAAGLLSTNTKNEAQIKELVASLRGIYVKSFEFDQEGAYSPADIKAVRDQLEAPGWSRLVATESRKEQELVEVHAWRQGAETGGLAILVAEPKELTIVNILGTIDLNKLRALEGQFGIPKLPLGGGDTTKEAKPKPPTR
jgi:hypothetical protein